ncbi:MAG: AMP-binding protein, partial [Bryobacteraceae bacterium]
MFVNSSANSEAAVYETASQTWRTYAELRADVRRLASSLDCGQKELVLSFCRNDLASLAWYLAGIEAGHAVALLSADLPAESRTPLIDAYRPEFITSSVEIAVAGTHERIGPVNHLWRRETPEAPPIHPDLALLLSTSGSTGSSKFVRLSAVNIRSNAESIVRALAIHAEDRAITSLPLHYSYGLSVVNTHLLTGAALVLSDRPQTSPEFWAVIRENQCTSFAGVPYSYEILNRLGLENLNVPSLHTLTQAGGKLRDDLITAFSNAMERRRGRFFVMYGQTEAAARISVLPSHLVSAKLGSAGLPIPGGTVETDASDGAEGELIYSGPNVMMGYASCRDDLALGDMLGGKLYTGDRARIDPE